VVRTAGDEEPEELTTEATNYVRPVRYSGSAHRSLYDDDDDDDDNDDDIISTPVSMPLRSSLKPTSTVSAYPVRPYTHTNLQSLHSSFLFCAPEGDQEACVIHWGARRLR
jgi:hypothetical protein